MAAFAFFGAALLPLAAFLPGQLAVSAGPAGTPLLSASAPLNLGAGTAFPAALLVTVGVLGILVRLIRTARAVHGSNALANRARPIDGTRYGLPGGIGLAVSDEVSGPVLAGLACPRILIPRRLLALPAPELARLLAHERGHAERGDLRRALRQRLVEDLYWWNPAMRRLGRHLDEAREIACDEDAAQGERQGFARCLLREARRRCAPRREALALGATDASGLERRIDRLIRPRRPAPRFAWAVVALALLATMTATPRLPTSGATHVGLASSSGLYSLRGRLARLLD